MVKKYKDKIKLGLGVIILSVINLVICNGIAMGINTDANSTYSELSKASNLRSVSFVIFGVGIIAGAWIIIKTFKAYYKNPHDINYRQAYIDCYQKKNLVFTYYFEEKIIGKKPCGKYMKRIVLLDSVSGRTRNILYKRIRVPMEEIFALAKTSEKAIEVYNSYSPYIESVANDVSSAIEACKNPVMEDMLIKRISVVTDFIDELRVNINRAIKAEKEEKLMIDKVEAQGYSPFTLTECLNELIPKK